MAPRPTYTTLTFIQNFIFKLMKTKSFIVFLLLHFIIRGFEVKWQRAPSFNSHYFICHNGGASAITDFVAHVYATN